MGLTVCRSNTSTWEKDNDSVEVRRLSLDKLWFLCPLMLLQRRSFSDFEKIRILRFFFSTAPHLFYNSLRQ